MKVTIITINYNNTHGLEKTMNSVLSQTYSDIEYIVIDGGSTDGSKEVVERNQAHLAYWVSEPDQGVYHAMNKGIEQATGEYVMFLNSGDRLLHEEIITDFVSLKPTEDILYGFLKLEGHPVLEIKDYPKELEVPYFFNDSLPHSGAGFFRRARFKGELRCFDESLKIVADLKWIMIGLFKKNFTYRLIDSVIGVFEYGNGISSHLSNRGLLEAERDQVIFEEFPEYYKVYEKVKYLESKLKSTEGELRIYKSSRFVKGYFKIKRLFKFR